MIGLVVTTSQYKYYLIPISLSKHNITKESHPTHVSACSPETQKSTEKNFIRFSLIERVIIEVGLGVQFVCFFCKFVEI